MTTPQRIDGIDISHHQRGALDFLKAKAAGLLWVYHKATEGTTFTDINYAHRRDEVAQAGLPFGAYHFARPTGNDARAEAEFFLLRALPQPGDLRPMLDLEDTGGMMPGALERWAAEFIQVIREKTGHDPIVYTPFDLGAEIDGLIVWRPRYNNDNTPPVLPWDIWQFSNGVLGVPNALRGIGKVDLNTMRDGLTVQQMRIPVKEKPVRSKQIRVGQSSMQFSDTEKQFAHDLRTVFSYAPHVQGFTEITGDFVQIFRDICKELGYKPILPDGRGDCALAVRTRHWGAEIQEWGADHAIDAKPGPAREGGHRARANVWVTVEDPDLGVLHFNENHMVTGSSKSLFRHRQVLSHLRLAGKRGRKQSRGPGLSWMMCDLNVDPQDFRGKRVYRLIERLGWEPAFEELKRWPGTHGRRTIDLIMHWDADRRVDPTRMRVGRKHLFTDHDNLFVDYEVKFLER